MTQDRFWQVACRNSKKTSAPARGGLDGGARRGGGFFAGAGHRRGTSVARCHGTSQRLQHQNQQFRWGFQRLRSGPGPAPAPHSTSLSHWVT